MRSTLNPFKKIVIFENAEGKLPQKTKSVILFFFVPGALFILSSAFRYKNPFPMSVICVNNQVIYGNRLDESETKQNAIMSVVRFARHEP